MNINEIIAGLSLEQKAALLQGWTTWTSWAGKPEAIPVLFLSDGPHGLRKQAGAADHLGLNASLPATCFPTAATMANSWDESLGEALGEALGKEAAANDVHVLLGPGLNIKRSPLCGRNFEYFSEDPYLAGKMAAAYIRGIQSRGVVTAPKHFAANSQELRRMSMDSVVDERTLREIYLTGFEMAVKEGGSKGIMTSYNRVNGCYANENPHLLADILRGDWGFDGFVVTDWGGDNDHVEGVRAGCNLVMPAPGPDCAIELLEAVKEGRIDEAVLDQRIEEFLKVAFPAAEAVAKADKSFDIEAHHALARRCAAGSIVLLENDGVLPLDKEKSVALIGDFAETPRYQGAGSSVVNPTKLDSLKGELESRGLTLAGYSRGYSRTDPHANEEWLNNAEFLAKLADVVLLCVGLDEIAESEGMDRSSLALSPGQQRLIQIVTAANPNVVLVLSGGAPFVFPENSGYRAAIHGYLGGQAGAAAMADALLGTINPSGKLAESWPWALEDAPSTPYFPSKEKTAEYREGLYVGYRYYDTAGVPLRYPFGYGLSYTSFAYSDIQASNTEVSFTVTNTGAVDGAEVAQLYVGCPGGKIFRPKKELKGFAKVFLAAGESRRVCIALDDKAFRYFNVKTQSWEIETADYEISVAASVADIRLTATLSVAGTEAPLPYDRLPSYESGAIQAVGDEEFEALLGRPIPDGCWGGTLQANDALCQMYYAKAPLARGIAKLLAKLQDKAEAKGVPDLNILFINNMPFRAIGKMTGGMISRQMVADILFMVNGHVLRGLGRLIRDFFRNLSANRKFRKALGER